MLLDTSALLRLLQPLHPQGEIVRGATRPAAQNGLGLSIPHATDELMRLKSMFPLLPDTPAHDDRLVAAMQVHGLTAILTFDKTGFSRYAGIEVVHPADAAA